MSVEEKCPPYVSLPKPVRRLSARAARVVRLLKREREEPPVTLPEPRIKKRKRRPILVPESDFARFAPETKFFLAEKTLGSD